MTDAPKSETIARQGFKLTGWHVLGALVLFFGATVAVDIKMVMDAYRSYPGEVASTPYEDGLAFDSELDQQRAQTALGWRMTIGLAGRSLVVVTARDANEAPIANLRLRARLERPATEQGKQILTFRERAPGVYQARAIALTGAWDLRLIAYDARGRRFDAERRFVAP